MKVSVLQDRITLSDLGRDHISFGLRPLEAHTFLQTANYPVKDGFSIGYIVSEACGIPDVWGAFLVQFRWKEEFESRRQPAHDQRATSSAPKHAATEDGRISTIALLPVPVTQDGDGRQRRRGWRGLRPRCAARLLLWWLRLPVLFHKIATERDLC